MRSRLVLATLALVAVGAAPAPKAIPFRFDDVRVYLPVAMQGGSPAWFIVDTGSTATVVDDAEVLRLGLTPEDIRARGGAGAGTSQVGRVRGVTFDVAGVPHRPTAVTTTALSTLLPQFTGNPAPGVLGSAFFREHTVTLDFDRSVAQLDDPDRIPATDGGVVVPLAFENDLPYARMTLRLPGGRRVEAKALVDLGAKATLLLTEPFIARENLRAAFPDTIVSPLGAGLGGPTQYAFARLPQLAFAPDDRAALDSTIVGLSVGGALGMGSADALLGAGYLSRFRVTFDYARRRMILWPRAGLPRPEFDLSGMFLVAEGDSLREYRVERVFAGGPAARAGLRADDRIVAVAAAPAATRSLGALRDHLASTPGRIVRLTIERAGSTFGATLALRPRI